MRGFVHSQPTSQRSCRRSLPLFALVILSTACGHLPDGGSEDKQPHGDRCRDYQNGFTLSAPAQMESLNAWWAVDLEVATTNEGAGTQYEGGLSKSFASEGFTAIINRSGHSDGAFLIWHQEFDYIRTIEGRGSAIAGTASSLEGDHSVSVLAVVEDGGSLRFIQDCRAEGYTEVWGAYVAENHPGKTEEEVLLEVVTTGSFEDFELWSQDPPPTPWVERDPWHRQIDPGETPAEILEQLDRLRIEYRGIEAWASLGGGSLCPLTPVGWGVCISLTGLFDGGSPFMYEYVVSNAPLQIWLFDQDLGFHLDEPERLVAEPVGLIGTVNLSGVDSERGVLVQLHGGPVSFIELREAIRTNPESVATVSAR